MPNLVAYLNRTPILEWFVVWCGSKNKYQKDMCLKEIGLHPQNMVIILNLIININGGLYDYLKSTRISILIRNKIFI